MNVLELCLSPSLGGLELYVFRTSQALLTMQSLTDETNPKKYSTSKNGNIITVLTKGSKLDNYFEKNSNINRHNLKRKATSTPLLSAKKLANIIDKNNIDIIHLHWNKDFPLAVFAKVFSKRHPAIVYTRHMMITRKKDDIYHNFLHRHLDLMLVISKELESLCKKFIPLYAKNITTLYHGVKEPKIFLDKTTRIDNRKKLTFNENNFVVGIIGRLEKNKGQHLLISAIKLAKQHNYNIKALIVGHETETDYRQKLKQQADDLGISDQISFKEFTSQPQQLMQLCDCIVLATENETFGLVLPEAMRAGIAVIGSNSGGVPEIIQHNKTGLLFKTDDDKDLFKQIERLYLDENLKRKLASQGKLDADKRFSDTLHFQRLKKHFSSLHQPTREQI